jgi:hypothetical protein
MLMYIKLRIVVEGAECGVAVAVTSGMGLPLQEPGRIPESAWPR